jgi:hypothetical protein
MTGALEQADDALAEKDVVVGDDDAPGGRHLPGSAPFGESRGTVIRRHLQRRVRATSARGGN